MLRILQGWREGQGARVGGRSNLSCPNQPLFRTVKYGMKEPSRKALIIMIMVKVPLPVIFVTGIPSDRSVSAGMLDKFRSKNIELKRT